VSIQALNLATRWRPLPDLTFVIIDDVDAQIERAERRDRTVLSHEDKRFHCRAAALFERLVAEAPVGVAVIDRRLLDRAGATMFMRSRISEEISNRLGETTQG
jgi:dTMP kinase